MSLAGRVVIVTRPREQADALRAALMAHGARVAGFPTIAVRAVDDPGPLDRALGRLETYAWVVFTSVNAVRFVADRLGDRSLPAGVRVAAVGPATAAAARARGLRVDAIPEEFVGTAIANAVGDVRGRSVLVPRADLGREETLATLRDAGATVDAVTVYHTVPARPDPDGLAALGAGADAITFTSPSTFQNFLALLGTDAARYLAALTIASIGPVTSAAIRAAGWAVHVEPSEHTADGLVAALVHYYASRAPRAAGEPV